MREAECGHGHIYDADIYSSCPYCGKNQWVDLGMQADVGGNKVVDDQQVTVPVMQTEMNIVPVVGWLVCIEGKEKGKDHKLYGQTNTVGRSRKMDVCIECDKTISKENHARIAYDHRHNCFNLIPGESINNIYINGEVIYVPTRLNAYDLIELGETKFLFVPFCCEKFSWDKGVGQ